MGSSPPSGRLDMLIISEKYFVETNQEIFPRLVSALLVGIWCHFHAKLVAINY